MARSDQHSYQNQELEARKTSMLRVAYNVILYLKRIIVMIRTSLIQIPSSLEWSSSSDLKTFSFRKNVQPISRQSNELPHRSNKLSVSSFLAITVSADR